jgi:AcrR family transcriptional regulator
MYKYMTASTEVAKGGKRARTRAALIQAAGDLIRDLGYEGATLEAIAARAGMTRGAIYGNFADRDALFAAVALERWSPVIPPHVAGSSLAQHMAALGRAYFQAARERAPTAAHSAFFQVQARRHEDLRRRLADQARRINREVSEALLRLYPQSELPMPAEDLVKALGALGEGLMAAYFVDPDAYPQALFEAAFEAMAADGGRGDEPR